MDQKIKECCVPLTNHHWCGRNKSLLLVYTLPSCYEKSEVRDKLILEVGIYKGKRHCKRSKIKSYLISERLSTDTVTDDKTFFCLIELEKPLGSMGIKSFDIGVNQGDYYIVSDVRNLIRHLGDKNCLASGFETTENKKDLIGSFLLVFLLLSVTLKLFLLILLLKIFAKR